MFKKLICSLITILAISTSAQANIIDLTTFSKNIGTSGSAAVTSNYANITATASISNLVSNLTSFQWFFQSNDYLPYNDFAYVTLNGLQTVLSNVATVGNYGNSGWQTFNFASAYTGQITFGATNVLDNALSSQVFIKNLNTVPAPATGALLLTGLGLIGFTARRRKTL